MMVIASRMLYERCLYDIYKVMVECEGVDEWVGKGTMYDVKIC